MRHARLKAGQKKLKEMQEILGGSVKADFGSSQTSEVFLPGPLLCKLQNPPADIKDLRVCERALRFDQLHGRLRLASLCDQDGHAHGHIPVTAISPMDINPPPILKCRHCD